MKGTMAEYQVSSVTETAIMDVYPYTAPEEKSEFKDEKANWWNETCATKADANGGTSLWEQTSGFAHHPSERSYGNDSRNGGIWSWNNDAFDQLLTDVARKLKVLWARNNKPYWLLHLYYQRNILMKWRHLPDLSAVTVTVAVGFLHWENVTKQWETLALSVEVAED